MFKIIAYLTLANNCKNQLYIDFYKKFINFKEVDD